jgi:hypothetical protein
MTTTLSPSPLSAVRSAAADLGSSVKASGLGLKFPAEFDFEEWAWVGTRLGNLRNASAWWIADWIAHGFARYGAVANEAAEKFGLDPGTLSNYRAVAEAFELPRRRGNLSFSHHRETAYLPAREQDHWLLRAENEGLSVMALREALNATRPRLGPGLGPGMRRFSLVVPEERRARWEQAAEKAEMPFEEWAGRALDQAAA